MYSSQAGESSENFAFKLYSDGIRELTFQQGIEQDDVMFFFDALWNTSGTAGNEDDDIVTRLWSKNLPTVDDRHRRRGHEAVGSGRCAGAARSSPDGGLAERNSGRGQRQRREGGERRPAAEIQAIDQRHGL